MYDKKVTLAVEVAHAAVRAAALSVGRPDVEVLPYHALGVHKWQAFGLKYTPWMPAPQPKMSLPVPVRFWIAARQTPRLTSDALLGMWGLPVFALLVPKQVLAEGAGDGFGTGGHANLSEE